MRENFFANDLCGGSALHPAAFSGWSQSGEDTHTHTHGNGTLHNTRGATKFMCVNVPAQPSQNQIRRSVARVRSALVIAFAVLRGVSVCIFNEPW